MKLANTTSKTHQDEAREAAIVQNLDIVNNLARRIQHRLPPCVTFDDLRSAGTIGLIEAVDRFAASRGLKLRSYAQHRVWGAILDFLRGEDPLSRTERRRVRESALTLGSPVTISLDQLPAPALNRVIRTEDLTATESVMRWEVLAARRCLSARENRVIALLYDFGWQNRQVAADLKVNESRVSQIKHRALAKLRANLSSRSMQRVA